jgi:zinc/manganese transport system permease protein
MNFHALIVAPFHYGFMCRAVLSAALLSVSGGLLGSILVLRRLALMGDALSHSLLPGVALLTALGSALLSRLTRVKEDASFGSLFLVFFGTGVALLSRLPTQLNLEDFLFGSVLSVGPSDLELSGVISALTLLLFALGYRAILLESFDPIFHRAVGGRGGLAHAGVLALTVLNLVAAMRTMGVVLALGLFLLPAASAYLWCDHFRRLLALAVALGIACSAAGILLSYHAGIASGAAIVLCLGAVFLVSALFSPRHGAAARALEFVRGRRRVAVSPD